jgi:hypothetical protein
MKTGVACALALVASLSMGTSGLATDAPAVYPASPIMPANPVAKDLRAPTEADASSAMQRYVEAWRNNDALVVVMDVDDEDLDDASVRWNMEAAVRRAERNGQGKELDEWNSALRDAEAERDGIWGAVWSMVRDEADRERAVALVGAYLAQLAPQAVGKLDLLVLEVFNLYLGEPGRDADEKHALAALRDAARAWLQRTDFTDPGRLRAALATIGAAIERSGLESPGEWRALPFDDAVAHGALAVMAAKQVAPAFDIDLSAVVESFRAREIAREGELAVVRVEFTAFEVPVSLRLCMRWTRSRWSLFEPGTPCPLLASPPASSPGSPVEISLKP